MAAFKLLWSSYAAAKGHALPTVKPITDRHPCDCRAAHDMARLCAASGLAINDRIRFRAAIIYTRICQEKFVEAALGDCRDAEVRGDLVAWGGNSTQCSARTTPRKTWRT